MRTKAPLGPMLRRGWPSLSRIPGGKALFSRLFGILVPYSGSVSPYIEELSPGFARVRIKDHRAIRNHLESVHAIALMNLAEMTSGLAMISGMPSDARAIITRLSIDYLRKARGTLTAECKCDPPSTNEKKEYRVESQIRDETDAIVARAEAVWLVGPTG